MMIFFIKKHVLFVQTNHMKLLTQRKFPRNQNKVSQILRYLSKNTMTKTNLINQKILYVGGEKI